MLRCLRVIVRSTVAPRGRSRIIKFSTVEKLGQAGDSNALILVASGDECRAVVASCLNITKYRLVQEAQATFTFVSKKHTEYLGSVTRTSGVSVHRTLRVRNGAWILLGASGERPALSSS